MNVLDRPVLGDTTSDNKFIITQQIRDSGSVNSGNINYASIGVGLLIAVIALKIMSGDKK